MVQVCNIQICTTEACSFSEVSYCALENPSPLQCLYLKTQAAFCIIYLLLIINSKLLLMVFFVPGIEFTLLITRSHAPAWECLRVSYIICCI